MRILVIFSVFFFGGTFLLAQPGSGQRQGGQGQGGQERGTSAQVQTQEGGQRPPWVQGAPTAAPGGRGTQPVMPGNQPVRPGQSATTQGNQQTQPRLLSPNQVNQMIARLRSMDTNQNGTLEASEIPANQRDRVNALVAQLGGNPNSNTFNLASLERRAMAAAGGTQPNQQQQAAADARQQADGRQQRQQRVAPLVPTFGEQVAAITSPLGFGQRVREVQTAPQATRGSAGQRGGANPQGAGAVPPPITARISTPYDNIPDTLRSNPNISWFFEFDADQDGQLSMLEYVNGLGGVWTEAIASEFVGYESMRNGERSWVNGLDRDGDGFATLDEVLLTVKERTELLAEESETQRTVSAEQIGRSQPGATSTVPANPRAQAGSTAGQGRQSPSATSGQRGATQGRMQGGQQSERGGTRGGGRGGG